MKMLQYLLLINSWKLRLDDILRQKVKILQGKNLDDLTLFEMEELVDGLRNIESKFVYQREILDLAISKAVDAHDMSLAAKFLVASLIVKNLGGSCPGVTLYEKTTFQGESKHFPVGEYPSFLDLKNVFRAAKSLKPTKFL